MRLTPVLVAVVAALLVLATAGHAGAASAASYRGAADRVCARSNAALAALPAPGDAGEARTWILRAVPVYVRAVGRLRGLDPPPALRVRHARWSTVLARRARLANGLRTRVARGASPIAALHAARPALERLQAQGRVRARALGLRTCAGR